MMHKGSLENRREHSEVERGSNREIKGIDKGRYVIYGWR